MGGDWRSAWFELQRSTSFYEEQVERSADCCSTSIGYFIARDTSRASRASHASRTGSPSQSACYRGATPPMSGPLDRFA